MKPLKETIDDGVLCMIRDKGAQLTGDRLALRSLLGDWKKTNFRRSDLFHSIARLESSGGLEVLHDANVVTVRLRLTGAQRMLEFPGDVPGVLYLLLQANDSAPPRRGFEFETVGRRRRMGDRSNGLSRR